MAYRGRATIAIAIAIAAIMLAGTLTACDSRAEARVGPAVGVQFQCSFNNWSDSDRITVLDKMKAAGLTWVRIPVGWSSIEPKVKGRYDFALNDKCVSMATARGFHVLETLFQTPPWANGNQALNVPPTNVNDYGDIAQVVAARYDGTHLASRGRVDTWEVWNEPDPSQNFWAGTIPKYVALVKASYGRFHAGNPNAKVVVGGPAGDRTWYIDKLYSAGLTGAYFDILSVHPYQIPSDNPPEAPDPSPGVYDWPGDGYITHTPTLRQLMKDHGDGAKPIWWTEFGWSTNTGGTDPHNTGVTQYKQGAFFVRTLKYATTNYPYVSAVFWYDARNDSRDRTDHGSNFGLLYYNLYPKPSYLAICSYLVGGC
jgi:aryl-phospho-beta-D-glucosidase BglC (GH1 family)